MIGQKTFQAKAVDVKPKWWIVDAEDLIIGRAASEIAVVLMGKHRPEYTPHVDTGDYVIVVNVEKAEFSGKKWENKRYTWYTGYPGLKSESAEDRRQRKPALVFEDAVRRMLPKNKLGRKMLSKLKLYVGTDHPHASQQPEPLPMKAKKKS